MRHNILFSWLYWHFYQAPSFLLDVWGNFLWASANFFSVPVLIMTFLSPWRRYRWTYPQRFAPGEWVKTFISNGFSRIMGAIFRFIFIIIGIVTLGVTVIVGAVAVVLWIVLPFVICGLLFFIVYG